MKNSIRDQMAKSNLLSKPIEPKITPKNTQQGATLVVVLLLLVLIMLAGIIAVKRSVTDLRMATSDQINTLLLQSADSANQKLEQTITTNPAAIESDLGMFGYFYNKPEHKSDEFIYCYDPKTPKFDVIGGYFRTATGGKIGNGSGCDVSQASSFITGRNISAVQVSVAPSPVASSPSNEDFGQTQLGEDVNGSGSTVAKKNFDVRSTSLLPAYNDPSDCLNIKNNSSLKPITDKEGLIGCLNSKSVPSKTLYEKVTIERETKTIQCVDFSNARTGRDATDNSCDKP